MYSFVVNNTTDVTLKKRMLVIACGRNKPKETTQDSTSPAVQPLFL
jgi:hypothetical protein